MAEKRMFSQKIIDSDLFLDMPTSAQCLYFHLCMRADDEGFLNNPKKIQRIVGSSDDDIRLLIAKRFIIPFDSGVVVIRHWKIHNVIRADRLQKTMFQDEKKMLTVEENRAYEMNGSQMAVKCQSNDSQLSVNRQSNDGIDKISIDKISIDKNSIDILSGKPDQLSTDIYTIIDYLNEVSGKHFKAGTPKTKTLIKARLNEGFTVDDFKTVIQKKYKQWKGGEMERYIRPETLFGTKFESYLNESEFVEIRNCRQETPSERAMRIRAEVLGSD